MQPTETSSTSSNPNFVGKIAAPSFSVPEKTTAEKVTTSEPQITEVITDYQAKMGRPYLVDVLGIHSLYEHENWASQVVQVDRYVLSRIVDEGLEKTKRAYESVIEKLCEELDIDPLTEFDKKLEKLSGYITVRNSQKEIEKLKRELGIDGDK